MVKFSRLSKGFKWMEVRFQEASDWCVVKVCGRQRVHSGEKSRPCPGWPFVLLITIWSGPGRPRPDGRRTNVMLCSVLCSTDTQKQHLHVCSPFYNGTHPNTKMGAIWLGRQHLFLFYLFHLGCRMQIFCTVAYFGSCVGVKKQQRVSEFASKATRRLRSDRTCWLDSWKPRCWILHDCWKPHTQRKIPDSNYGCYML